MTARVCSRCVLYEGMRFAVLRQQVPARALADFGLDDEGVCTLCRAWERDFDPRSVDLELARFVQTPPVADGAPVAIVALSGGKDSISTLAACVLDYDVPTVAMLLDNGFIPDDVVQQARAVCARLDVELVVRTFDDRETGDFRGRVLGATVDAESPCFTCSRALLSSLVSLARARGAAYVVAGTNYHAAWHVRVAATGEVRGVTRLHLPFAARHTAADARRNVQRAGAVVKRQERGISSNCAVPGLVGVRVAGALGHLPEREDVALEVVSGHMPRAEALALLDAHAAAPIQGHRG